MLGITTYQEALRALGGVLDRERAMALPPGEAAVVPQVAALPEHVEVHEDPARVEVRVSMGNEVQRLDAEALEAVVLASRARRGMDRAPAGPLSDLLRSVGLALDELRAVSIGIDLRPDRVTIGFAVDDAPDVRRSLSYAGEELAALRQAASRRRKGDPLRRVLILHADSTASAAVRELLVAEFAVQALPSSCAAAVARAGEPPDMVIIHTGRGGRGTVSEKTLEAVQHLRGSGRTARVPILVVVPADASLPPETLFRTGADDVIAEPFAPALFRARLRTWMLRGRRGSAEPALPPSPPAPPVPALP